MWRRRIAHADSNRYRESHGKPDSYSDSHGHSVGNALSDAYVHSRRHTWSLDTGSACSD
jgi:hypothetical protein